VHQIVFFQNFRVGKSEQKNKNKHIFKKNFKQIQDDDDQFKISLQKFMEREILLQKFFAGALEKIEIQKFTNFQKFSQNLSLLTSNKILLQFI
jgi:hypothetical protein